ncbi:MAG TPA: hypothetical protein VJ824_08715 [Bacillota bacterium]|nr:hypothetical protein [Bacillota bacterium]
MDFKELKSSLIGGDEIQKIEVLSFLSDVFESYNKNIEGFEEIVHLLIDIFVEEKSLEIKCEILETLAKGAIYQDIHLIDLSKLENNLERISDKCLSRCIDIFGFTHDTKYLEIIKKYQNHDDESIRESVDEAIREILESNIKQ